MIRYCLKYYLFEYKNKLTQQKKREIEIVVISDVHLGTFGCHAKELLAYLQSVKPKTLILNGDIIDIWQFRKNYFPKSHLKVIQKIINLSSEGTEVIYLTGNHDEMLRKFSDVSIGNLKMADKIVLNLDGKKAWFFHGDVFDVSITKAKWLAKLGGWGYDILILLNQFINFWLLKFKKEKYSLSKKVKNSVKKAIKYIQNFENVASDLAIENGYKYVVCGHIHQPKIIRKVNNNGTCLYLNSGDWVENLTALEYHKSKWTLVKYEELNLDQNPDDKNSSSQDLLTAITLFSKPKN
jgi:UDP-2,3-diacylglucosamine pyrophosphatase LpxH